MLWIILDEIYFLIFGTHNTVSVMVLHLMILNEHFFSFQINKFKKKHRYCVMFTLIVGCPHA
jgi:hypothetical protein